MINTARSDLSEKTYQAGLLLLAVALPFSNFLMSVSQIMLLAAWLIAGNYILRINLSFSSKSALLFFLFYAVHLVGVLYTLDFHGAMNDIRVKLPLLLLPLVISGMPVISNPFLKKILSVFVTGVFLQSILVIINNEWIFISPIRFSMMVSFSVFAIMYLGFSQGNTSMKIISCLLAGWMLFFLAWFPYDTGIVTFVCALSCYLLLKIFRSNQRWIKITSSAVILILIGSSAFFIYSGVRNFYGDAHMPSDEQYTAQGAKYFFYPENKEIEEGDYVWKYIAWNEFENAWSERSALPLHGNDKSGQSLSITAIRFMTSKHYRKDAEGVSKLTDEEVRAIENGIANVRYMDGLNLSDRLYEAIWSLHEYNIGKNPQGSSIGQRLEYWKAGWNAFIATPVFGNGTGSVLAALNEQYQKMNTVLDKSYRLKTHNQYLATAVALGIIGESLLLLLLLFPFFREMKWKDGLYLTFLAIVLTAMLVEDTLETQAGVTFVAFFSSLLLFSSERRDITAAT